MTIYNQTAVEADGSISWRNGLTFCGVHDIGKKTLYLSESLTTILTDGQAPFASKTIPSVVDEICGRINQCVEETIANDRNNLSVQEVTSWQAARELKEYLEDGAHREAIDWFFRGSEPDGQFHSGYTLGNLPEATFMAWLQNPEGLIQTEADQHIKINQEKFLLQFLKNDALVAEYQAIVQTQGIPGDGGANRQYIRSGGIRRQRLRRQIPPELSEQTRQNILSGLELYAQEMRANDEELEQWAAECDSLAGSLKKQWYPAQPGMEMRKYDFWNLIAGAKEECGQDMDASLHWLYEQLAARGPQQAQDFHDILYGYQKLSYQYGLWTAASLMCENVCDYNDFSYFRGWLIAQGREVYLAALADPDSLTDVETYGGCQFEDLYYIGDGVLEDMTGQNAYDNTDPDMYEALVEELRKDIIYGEGVDYPYEWGEIEAYFPRLCEKYLEPGTVDFHLKHHDTMFSSDFPGIQEAREGGPPQRNGPQTDVKMEGM